MPSFSVALINRIYKGGVAYTPLSLIKDGQTLYEYQGGDPGPGFPRVATPDTAAVLFAGHSFVQTAYGYADNGNDLHGGILYQNWPGTTLSDYVPFASTESIWNLDANLRNSTYNVAITSEVADLQTGFPALDSSSGISTLQYLYWYSQSCDANSAELVLQDVWSPVSPDLDTNARGFFQGAREWLQTHTGKPVWIIPANPFVRAMRQQYGDTIFEDGLHLDRTTRYARATSYLVYSFLTQERCPFVVAGDEAVDQLAWDTLLEYECAGMGGTTEYTSALPSTDPLPAPVNSPDI